MKFIFTKHLTRDKLPILKELGWTITKAQIRNTIKNPKWTGITKRNQETAMSVIDKKHILRVIFKREGDIIKVITVHIARRGKYESTLR